MPPPNFFRPSLTTHTQPQPTHPSSHIPIHPHCPPTAPAPGDDKLVKLWDVATHRELHTFYDHVVSAPLLAPPLPPLLSSPLFFSFLLSLCHPVRSALPLSPPSLSISPSLSLSHPPFPSIPNPLPSSLSHPPHPPPPLTIPITIPITIPSPPPHRTWSTRCCFSPGAAPPPPASPPPPATTPSRCVCIYTFIYIYIYRWMGG